MNNEEQQELEQQNEPEALLQQDQELIEEAKSEDIPGEIKGQAKKFGHLSADEWKNKHGTMEGYKTEEEFVKFGNQYSETHTLVKSLQQELRDLRKEHSDAVKRSSEESVKKAKEILEQQLTYAKQHNNLDAVEQLALRKAQMESQQLQEAAQRAAQDQAEANLAFTERNKHWYNEQNPHLQEKAKEYARQVFQDNPRISYHEAAMRVENRMKWEHPEVSQKTNQAPHILSSKSTLNKSVAESNVSMDTRSIKSLSSEQQIEYKSIAEHIKSRYGDSISYTIQDYIDATKRHAKRL